MYSDNIKWFLTAIKPKVVYTNPDPSQSRVSPLYRVLTKRPAVGRCVSCLRGCFHHIGCTLFADPTSVPEVHTILHVLCLLLLKMSNFVTIFLKRFIFILCLWIFCLCVYLCPTCTHGAHRGQNRTIRSTGAGVRDSCDRPYGCWEPSLGSLEQKQTALNHQTILPAFMVARFVLSGFGFVLWGGECDLFWDGACCGAQLTCKLLGLQAGSCSVLLCSSVTF